MFGFVSEPLRSDETAISTSEYGDQANFHQGFNNYSGSTRPTSTVTMTQPRRPQSEADITAGQKMLSAVSGSLLTSLLVTPLDVVRVRLQSQPHASLARSYTLPTSFSNLPANLGVSACCREVFWVNNASPYCMVASPSAISNLASSSSTSAPPSSSIAAAANCAVDEMRQKNFTSTLDGLRKIARNEGLQSLWRGLSPTLVMAIPANVIYFTGYDHLRSDHRSPINKYVPDAYAPLIAGSIARVAAASVISPIEMFRTRMQAATSGGTSVFTETFVGLRQMVQAQGYTSLWRGLTLTMWRDVPFSGIYWWGYEVIRNGLTDLRDPPHSKTRPRSKFRGGENDTATFVDSFAAGAVSGGVASIVTTPFDVGKTRQQVLAHSPKDASGSKGPSSKLEKTALRPEDRSMPRFLYSIWKEEGTAGLFRGWAARCLKVAPACAIMISSYEVGKKMARRMNEKKAEGI